METSFAHKPQNLRLECIGYPGIFDLDKALCKGHFRQFGKIRRLIYKQRQQAIVVEYIDPDEFQEALAKAGDFNGHRFQVQPFESKGHKIPPDHIATKKKIVRDKHRINYVDNDEVNSELAAMSGYSDLKEFNISKDKTDKKVKAPKLNRLWKKGPDNDKCVRKPTTPKNQLHDVRVKKKSKDKIDIVPGEHLELLKILNSQAQTVEDKYNILDARDKLLRLDRKNSKLNTGPTQGTCPDMCPEKERLLREIRYQIALFEQTDGDRHTMDHNKAIKQYSRSSADQEAPLAHELRPVSVLQLTMNYLIHNIVDLCDKDNDLNIAEWYHFVWDRTRGIRKDITQQALSCQGAVELVEQCARFHIYCSARLAGEEPSVFDQKINTENLTKCLQTLKYMYHDLELKGEKCSKEAEFRAYIILLNLNDGNFLWEVQKLRPEIQGSPEVKFAIEVHSAIDKNNYVKFFKLIRSTTYLNACILMRYFVQVRLQAIETLVKCYTPPKSISFYPVEVLMNLLYFDDIESTTEFLKMCGLNVNMNNNRVLIDRNSFKPEELSYALERSNRIEGKREGSVALVVSGVNITAEMYLEMQTHQVHGSFDNKGYLIQDDLFNKIEKQLEDTLLEANDDSRESSPERKTIVTNIFAQKSPANVKATLPVKGPNIFSQTKPEIDNIFAAKPKSDTKTEPFKPLFDTNSNSNSFSQNIFGNQQKDNFTTDKLETNIFMQQYKKKEKSNDMPWPIITANREQETSKYKDNIFAISSSNFNAKDGFSFATIKSNEIIGKIERDETDNMESQSTNVGSVFDVPQFSFTPVSNLPVADIFQQKNIFASSNTVQTRTFPDNKETVTKSGGFHFILKEPPKIQQQTSNNIFSSGFTPTPAPELMMQTDNEMEFLSEPQTTIAELQQKQIKFSHQQAEAIQRQKQQQKEQLEAKQRAAEEEKKRLETEKMMIERHKREREMKLKREQEEEEKRKQAAAEAEKIRRRNEELERERREQEKQQEIQLAVEFVVMNLVETIETTIRNEKLKQIRNNIQKRLILRIYAKWRENILQKIKLRKALSCNSINVVLKSVEECAEDLRSRSQDLTLTHMRRYKYGQPVNILIKENSTVKQIDVYNLTYSLLRRRFCTIQEKWYQHIYWKVVISIPDVDEMFSGLNKLENNLHSYINWQLDKYGRTLYIEDHKTVTYCIEKRQGVHCLKSPDANAFVFIAKNFNDLLQERVFENLKGYGVCVTLPIVLILEDTTSATEYLENLQTSGVVSECTIYSCNLCSSILTNIIDNALSVLSKSVEKYPPLEMDTFYGFMKTNLCSEIWKKAEAYAKWNREYNFCMRDPNIVIHLYNEGLDLLSDIILSKMSKEYAIFAEEFRQQFPDKMPEVMPCDYKYFPNFWKTSSYENKLRKIIDNLKLPKFLENWPPHNETELLLAVSKYCTKIFQNPKAPYISLLNVLKNDIDSENQYDKILWTKAIQVISREKLNEQNLDLPKSICDHEIFKTFIVVYDKFLLNEYCTCEWFYRNNPVIESYKKTIYDKVEKENTSNRSTAKTIVNTRKRNLEIDEAIEKASKLLNSKKIHLERKNEMEKFAIDLRDLNDSMNVMRQINELSKSMFSK